MWNDFFLYLLCCREKELTDTAKQMFLFVFMCYAVCDMLSKDYVCTSRIQFKLQWLVFGNIDQCLLIFFTDFAHDRNEKRCVLPWKLFDWFSVLHIITQLLFAIFFVLFDWGGEYIEVVNCIFIMYHGLWIFVYFVVWEIACIRVHSLFRGMPRKRRRRGCS